MLKNIILVITLVPTLLLVFTACGGKTERTVLQYMPHMHTTPVMKPQRGYEDGTAGASVLMPPKGTIPRGFFPYTMKSAEEAGLKLKNPLPFSREVIHRGRDVYNIYCYACHGERGIGDGPVVPPYPIPKSLVSDQARGFVDGHLYHVITKGQGVMPAYASQVTREDRWAIIQFLRVLQRAENPKQSDLDLLEQRKVN